MKFFASFAFAATLVALVNAHITFRGIVEVAGFNEKRAYRPCSEVYGAGSTTCGDVADAWCYNPTIGETCCPGTHSLCEKDFFCAPGTGYCCRNGEDLATCAVRQGFTLTPSAATSTLAAAASSSLTTATTSSSGAIGTTATSTASVVAFTGAAVKKDSTARAMLIGAIGLMAAL